MSQQDIMEQLHMQSNKYCHNTNHALHTILTSQTSQSSEFEAVIYNRQFIYNIFVYNHTIFSSHKITNVHEKQFPNFLYVYFYKIVQASACIITIRNLP